MLVILFFTLILILIIYSFSIDNFYNIYKFNINIAKLYYLIIWILKGYILLFIIIGLYLLIPYLTNDNNLLFLIIYSLLIQNINRFNKVNIYNIYRKINYEHLSLQSSILGKDFFLYKLLFGTSYISFSFALPLFANVVVYSLIGDVPAIDINGEVQELLSEINRLFSQLNTFINQFHNFVNETGINVVTDGYGSLDIDVLETVSDSTAQTYANRINVFDRLIHDRIHNIEELIDRISDLELQIMQSDTNYISQLPQYRVILANLVRSYGHIHS